MISKAMSLGDKLLHMCLGGGGGRRRHCCHFFVVICLNVVICFLVNY